MVVVLGHSVKRPFWELSADILWVQAKHVDTESQKPTGVSEGAAAPTNIRVPLPTKEFYFMYSNPSLISYLPNVGTL